MSPIRFAQSPCLPPPRCTRRLSAAGCGAMRHHHQRAPIPSIPLRSRAPPPLIRWMPSRNVKALLKVAESSTRPRSIKAAVSWHRHHCELHELANEQRPHRETACRAGGPRHYHQDALGRAVVESEPDGSPAPPAVAPCRTSATCPPARKAARKVAVSSWARASSAAAAEYENPTGRASRWTVGGRRPHLIRARPIAIRSCHSVTSPSRARQQEADPPRGRSAHR